MKTVFLLILVLLFLNAPVVNACSQQPEKVKLITSTDIDTFVKDLNDNGKLGYRLENSLSYGGEGVSQRICFIRAG